MKSRGKGRVKAFLLLAFFYESVILLVYKRRYQGYNNKIVKVVSLSYKRMNIHA
jgi:hypothetical protein